MLGSKIHKEREKERKSDKRRFRVIKTKAKLISLKSKVADESKIKEPKIKIKINAKEVESQPTINIIHTYGKTFLDIA